MKNTKVNKTNKLSGFTLDQTILVVAVIAILATIIISSVAWNVLNRANATKMNAHLTQITNAIGNFYQDNDYVWPDNAEDLAPYLAGYNVITGGRLTTPFGTSGAQSEFALANGNTGGTRLIAGGSCTKSSSVPDCYITLTMTNVQVQELLQANESIDGPNEGTQANTKGRLRWGTGGDSDRVTLTYYAVKLI
jgi:Tfp pilus assembly protein PilE